MSTIAAAEAEAEEELVAEANACLVLFAPINAGDELVGPVELESADERPALALFAGPPDEDGPAPAAAATTTFLLALAGAAALAGGVAAAGKVAAADRPRRSVRAGAARPAPRVGLAVASSSAPSSSSSSTSTTSSTGSLLLVLLPLAGVEDDEEEEDEGALAMVFVADAFFAVEVGVFFVLVARAAAEVAELEADLPAVFFPAGVAAWPAAGVGPPLGQARVVDALGSNKAFKRAYSTGLPLSAVCAKTMDKYSCILVDADAGHQLSFGKRDTSAEGVAVILIVLVSACDVPLDQGNTSAVPKQYSSRYPRDSMSSLGDIIFPIAELRDMNNGVPLSMAGFGWLKPAERHVSLRPKSKTYTLSCFFSSAFPSMTLSALTST